MAHDDDKRLTEKQARPDFERARAQPDAASRGSRFDLRTHAQMLKNELAKQDSPDRHYRPPLGSPMRRAGNHLTEQMHLAKAERKLALDRSRTSFSMEELQRFR